MPQQFNPDTGQWESLDYIPGAQTWQDLQRMDLWKDLANPNAPLWQRRS